MRTRLLSSYLVVVFFALALFTVPVAASSASLLRSTLETTSVREAELFAPLLLRQDVAAVTAIADRTRDFERATGSVVRLVRADGEDRTAGEVESPLVGTADADTPEDAQVREALAGRDPAPRWAPSPLLGADAVAVVLPVSAEGRVVAAVQVITPTAEVDEQIRDIWTFRLLVGLGVLVVAGVVAVLIADTLVRPLRRLDAVARRIGDGDYGVRASETGPRETAALARTLNHTARRTGALMVSQRVFVADASHQLRTPLTAVRLCLDNVRDTTDDPLVQERLSLVESEVDRMGRIVEGLLALTRAEAAATAPEPIDLAEVVTTRAEVWEAAFAEAGVEGRVTAAPSTWVVAVPGALEQVLDNVLDNALAVAPRGSAVEVTTRRLDQRVELTVRDRGPGMTAEQRGRAFDRFWRAGPPGTGSGLGLAVVRQLVEHDGGSVELVSPPGGGLVVRILLRAP